MRRTARASFARTNRRQGLSGLGRIFGGVFGARGAANGADGSGASSAGRRGPVRRRRGPLAALLTFAALAVIVVVGVAPALADTAPTVRGLSAPSATLHEHTAKLKAEVNPKTGPSETEWEFEISSVGNTGPWTPIAGGGSLTADNTYHVVESEATGLEGNKKYWYRIVATNEGGGNETTSSGSNNFTTNGPRTRALSISSITEHTALLKGEVNPGELPEEASWHFEVSSVGSTGPWTPVAGGGSLVSDETFHEVESEATGLAASSDYWARLVAEKPGSEPAQTPATAFATLGPPTAVTTWPTLSPNGAAWHVAGRVRPNGFDTHYFFEYGPNTSYGNTSPVPPGDAGSGFTSVAVGADLFGLTPGAQYHFRLVAENSAGTAHGEDQTVVVPLPGEGPVSCPNEELRYGYGANLADCRAYEMASPVDKEGENVRSASVFAVQGPIAAANGEASSYWLEVAIEAVEPPSSGFFSTEVARRGADDWSSEQVDAPLGPILNFGADRVWEFTPDLDQTLLNVFESPLFPEGEENTPHLFLRNSAGSFQLLTSGVPPNLGAFAIVGRPFGMTADASHVVFLSQVKLSGEGGAGPYYVYDWSAASEALTLLAENVTPPRAGQFLSASGKPPSSAWHTVSADGTRVFYLANPVDPGVTKGELFVSVDGTSQFIGGPEARLWLANSDGSAAYFTEGGELYRYDVNADQVVNLTEGLAAPVRGVLGASDDGSRVYFAAEEGGEYSLYLWTAGAGIEPVVTGLSGADVSDWDFLHPTSRVSTNGMYVAFNSNNSVTGYPNAGHTEIYAYGAGSGVLSCASCNPSGAAATSGATLPPAGEFKSPTGFHTSLTWNVSRNVSNRGQVFFNSTEALVHGDVNGTQDVYEYDSVSGQTSLISSGASPYGSGLSIDTFTDAGASGRDVYFLTAESLVGADQDQLVDLYDAREGGGLASQNPGPSSPPCTGEACHLESTSPDQTTAPASTTVAGKGNLSSKQNCNKLGQEAKKLSKRAKLLRKHAKAAKRNGKSGVAKKRNKKATRLAKHARSKSKSAKKCRKRNRRASK